MKTSYLVSGIVVLIIIIGGVIWYNSNASKYSETPDYQQTPAQDQTQAQQTASPSQQTTVTSPTQTSQTVPVSTTSAPQSFTVNGNDSSADLTTITVAKGTPVSITFGADAGTTYHGGLDFRSSVVNTGTIVPGSTKTITFTADKSFSFTPYWPATNIAKPYTINIVVQ